MVAKAVVAARAVVALEVVTRPTKAAAEVATVSSAHGRSSSSENVMHTEDRWRHARHHGSLQGWVTRACMLRGECAARSARGACPPVDCLIDRTAPRLSILCAPANSSGPYARCALTCENPAERLARRRQRWRTESTSEWRVCNAHARTSSMAATLINGSDLRTSSMWGTQRAFCGFEQLESVAQFGAMRCALERVGRLNG